MDTSETYIKMCEKAVEIQAIWHNPELIGTYPSNKGFGLHYEQGYEGSFYAYSGWRIGLVDYEYCTSYDKPHIWLPRQDQLQEMTPYESRSYLWPIYNFACEQDSIDGRRNIYVFTSMEQLWLAFVMKTRWNKFWDGEDWV